MTRKSTLAVLFACVSTFLAPLSHAQTASQHTSPTLQPSADLSPRAVVEIQLEALRNNDSEDAGIAVVFRFASPANRAQTGPLPRFTQMLRNGPYKLMFDYESAVFDETEIAGNQARQRVVLINRQRKRGYFFILSRQDEGSCLNCWMTDMVGVVEIGGTMALAH